MWGEGREVEVPMRSRRLKSRNEQPHWSSWLIPSLPYACLCVPIKSLLRMRAISQILDAVTVGRNRFVLL